MSTPMVGIPGRENASLGGAHVIGPLPTREPAMKWAAFVLSTGLALYPASLRAEYKTEFSLSLNVTEDTSWGRAGKRFADAVRYRTQGRVRIKNHFEGERFKGQQTSEFQLLQDGIADFAIGSTINWSPQVKELNLFVLPFLFARFAQLDAVQAGEPGKLIFRLIEKKGVVPLAWGENGFRELTNASRPIRRPEDLRGLKIRTVGVPLLLQTFQALDAEPVSLNWGDAQGAFRDGTVDGQENPLALIIPYSLHIFHKHITLWHYAIDPLILAVSAKAWASLSAEDRKIVQRVATDVMVEQKKEAREGLDEAMALSEVLKNVYQMEVVHLTDDQRDAFRVRTRPVYEKWAASIGFDLVRTAEQLIAETK